MSSPKLGTVYSFPNFINNACFVFHQKWSLVYNPIDLEISFRTKDNISVRKLDMKAFDFGTVGSLAYALSDDSSGPKDTIPSFASLTKERNEKSVSQFFEKMVLLGEMDMEKALSLMKK